MSDSSNEWPPPAPRPAPQNSQPTTAYASFGWRFIAHIFDAIMLYVVEIPFSIVAELVGGGTGDLINIIGLVVAVYMLCYWTGSQGATPLRRTIGVLIIDETDGTYIGTRRAFTRWVVSIISGLALLIGYISMLWNPRKQTWHDRAAKTVVVKM